MKLSVIQKIYITWDSECTELSATDPAVLNKLSTLYVTYSHLHKCFSFCKDWQWKQ